MGRTLDAVKNKLRFTPPLPACPPNPRAYYGSGERVRITYRDVRIYLSRTKLTDEFRNNVLESEHYGDPVTNGRLSHAADAVDHSAALLSPSRPTAFSLTLSQLLRLFSMTSAIGCILMVCSVWLVARNKGSFLFGRFIELHLLCHTMPRLLNNAKLKVGSGFLFFFWAHFVIFDDVLPTCGQLQSKISAQRRYCCQQSSLARRQREIGS